MALSGPNGTEREAGGIVFFPQDVLLSFPSYKVAKVPWEKKVELV